MTSLVLRPTRVILFRVGYSGIVKPSLLQEKCSAQSRALSTVSSLFQEPFSRSRRRRRRRGVGSSPSSVNHRHQESNPDTEQEDTRTVRDILFPGYDSADVPEGHKIYWPRSLSEWRVAVASAWSDYKSTWDGFFTSRGFVVEDDPTKSRPGTDDKKEKEREVGAEVATNAKRNARLLKEETESLRTKIRDRTGIHNNEDLKQVAADMMKLFSDCVKEFMSGYRKGRNDEVEKMLTQYFQELEHDTNKPKRRKRKRRILLGHRGILWY